MGNTLSRSVPYENIQTSSRSSIRDGPPVSERSSALLRSTSRALVFSPVRPCPDGMLRTPTVRSATAQPLDATSRHGRNPDVEGPQANDSPVVRRTQARAPATIANARTTATQATTQQKPQNRPHHRQQALKHVEQLQVARHHESFPGARGARATSYTSNVTPDAGYNYTTHTSFNANKPHTTATHSSSIANNTQRKPSGPCAPVATDTQKTQSTDIPILSQFGPNPSPRSKTHVARSPSSTRHPTVIQSQLTLPQTGAPSEKSSHASRSRSTLGAPHCAAKPSPVKAPAANILLKPLDRPDLPTHTGLARVLGSKTTDAMRSETNKHQEVSGLLKGTIDKVARDVKNALLPKPPKVGHAAPIASTNTKSQEDLEVFLGTERGTDAQASPTLSVSRQRRTNMQPEVSPKSTTKTLKGSNSPSSSTKDGRSLQAQHQDAKARLFARGPWTALQDATRARQEMRVSSSSSGMNGAEVNAAMFGDHNGGAAANQQKVAPGPVMRDQSRALATSVTSHPRPTIVEGNQDNRIQHEKVKEPVVTVYSKAICAKCMRVSSVAKPCDLHCSGCKDVWYCGSACQRAGWKSHSRSCKKTEQPKSTLPDIPIEVIEIGARYDSDDEFSTTMMPLSEAVPCMICEGTKEHQPDCMAAGKCDIYRS